ncbi:MAG TPA: hypothetical protein VNH11_23395 [Pirellulales bacterium]|nr:hypothetical protein [Pirellulales bacterium]
MDHASARQKAIDHLTAVMADCNDALGAADVWYDYAPRDRNSSQALFRETAEVARRLLSSIEAHEPIVRADWQRVMPRDDAWKAVYKLLVAE